MREPAFTVTLDPSAMTVTMTTVNGLNERAMRDMDRTKWFTVGYGWNLTDKNDTGMFTKATATFLHEEFVAVCRYFDYVTQGIVVNRA